MKTVSNPFDYEINAFSANGVHNVRIPAGEIVAVRDDLFPSACAQGCLPEKGVDNPATEEVDESKIIMLEQIINQVLDEGDESLLTMEGCPKAAVLKERFGSHNAEEREQAWENVKATRDRD